MWLVLRLIQLGCRIFWLSVTQERFKNSFKSQIFAWKKLSREGNIWDYHLWLDISRCVSCSVRSSRSLERINILVFLHRVSYLGELASELLPLVTCSQLSLLPSQVAGSFDHQYLRKESNGIVNVLHGYNRQWKVASEATTLGGFWPAMPLVQWDWKQHW